MSDEPLPHAADSLPIVTANHFSHKRLHGVSSAGMQELLFTEAGVNWNDSPDGCKRGRVTVRRSGERPVEYVDKRTNQTVQTIAVRSWWETSAAPHFTTKPGDWLADTIPEMPSLHERTA